MKSTYAVTKIYFGAKKRMPLHPSLTIYCFEGLLPMSHKAWFRIASAFLWCGGPDKKARGSGEEACEKGEERGEERQERQEKGQKGKESGKGQKGDPKRNVERVVALNIYDEASQTSDQEPVVVPARVITLDALREELERSGLKNTLKHRRNGRKLACFNE